MLPKHVVIKNLANTKWSSLDESLLYKINSLLEENNVNVPTTCTEFQTAESTAPQRRTCEEETKA